MKNNDEDKKRLESQRSQVDNRGFRWASKTLWGYGVGHVQSDLVATMWFSYLLVFLEQIVGLSAVNAGILLIIGQLTDGIATPLVGLGLDKLGVCGAKYGKRKSWHLLGTILITISFPFIFSPPPGYDRNLQNWTSLQMMFYYTPFIVIFQIAWASAQVSHLSMIPCLTCRDSARVQLTSLRNAFTLLSSIGIYLSAYFLFMTSREDSDDSNFIADESLTSNITSNCSSVSDPVDQVSWEDHGVYSKLSLGAVALGLLFQGFVFHFLVHEPDNTAKCLTDDCENGETIVLNVEDGGFRKRTDSSPQKPFHSEKSLHMGSFSVAMEDMKNPKGLRIEIDNWYGWFKCPTFYLVAVQYCLTRLIVNITASYMPFYLQESLDLPKEYIATVPLVQFIVGFFVSFSMKPLSKHIGKNGTYFLGCILMIAGSICATVLETDQKYRLFLLPLFFGAGTSTILVQSLAMTAALIGENASSAAFVYGAMSLTDKIACGGAIMVVQMMSPCQDDMQPNGPCEENGCGLYYCRLLGYGIGAVTIAAIIQNVVHWHHTKKSETVQQR